MCACIVVGAAREGIGVVGCSQFMEEADIVVAKGENVVGEAAVDLLRAVVVLEVLVVSKDVNDEFSAQ